MMTSHSAENLVVGFTGIKEALKDFTYMRRITNFMVVSAYKHTNFP